MKILDFNLSEECNQKVMRFKKKYHLKTFSQALDTMLFCGEVQADGTITIRDDRVKAYRDSSISKTAKLHIVNIADFIPDTLYLHRDLALLHDAGGSI